MLGSFLSRLRSQSLLFACCIGLYGAGFSADAHAQDRAFYGFEGDALVQWFDGLRFVGDAGVDMGRGWAYSGDNNGWIGSTTPFNAIIKPLGTVPQQLSLQCWVKFRGYSSGHRAGRDFILTYEVFDSQNGTVYSWGSWDVSRASDDLWTPHSTNNMPTKAAIWDTVTGLVVGRPVSLRLQVAGGVPGNWIRIDAIEYYCR